MYKLDLEKAEEAETIEKTREFQLDEYQTGIQIPGRNISYLRYAEDTTLMAELKRN